MGDTPAELFESYEQDFRSITFDIQDKLEGTGKNDTGEKRKATLRTVEVRLDEADDIVSAMELELQGIPQSVKTHYTNRLKQAKADITRYKKLAKDMHALAARTELLAATSRGAGGPSSDDPYNERSDRERLLAGTQTLSDGSRRLTSTQRLALETEDQGAEILRTLRMQRETIENARDNLHGADTNIDKASGTLKKMIHQMYKQRFILSGIAAFAVLLILLVLYFKLVR